MKYTLSLTGSFAVTNGETPVVECMFDHFTITAEGLTSVELAAAITDGVMKAMVGRPKTVDDVEAQFRRLNADVEYQHDTLVDSIELATQFDWDAVKDQVAGQLAKAGIRSDLDVPGMRRALLGLDIAGELPLEMRPEAAK